MPDKKSPQTADLNLLPGNDLMGRPGGSFLAWALSWGKRIVIVTEAVVIVAFLSRFWLDTTLADLSEQITQRKNIIEASSNFEKKFRGVNERIAKARSVESLTSPVVILDQVKALIPNEATVSDITITGAKVVLNGESDEPSLATIVSNIRKSLVFSDFQVEKVAKTNPSTTINFIIQAHYTGGKTP